mgnify:CR=1 FL=1
MKNQKIDRRTRKTKKNLLQALTKLMSEKKITSITVTELTDIADVNRSTFYLYYKDIFDMVETIETEMLNEFSDAFQKISWENGQESLLAFFTYLFEFVQSNAEMCKILLGPDGNYTFIEKLKDVIKQSQPPEKSSLTNKEIHYYIPFIISGCIGAIQQWLSDNMNIPPKEMAAFIIKIL